MDKFRKTAYMLCLLLQLHQVVKASPHKDSSKIDSAQLIKEFFQVCTSYSESPLFLKLSYASSANYISSASDTSKIEAVFYITKTGSYIKFGEMEELVSDSLALVVSSELQRMILFTNTKPILRQMKAVVGIAMPDSTIKNFCNKYKVSKAIESNGPAVLHLTSRALIYSTSLSREDIKISYDENTKTPTQVITIKRSLIQLTNSEAQNVSARADIIDKLIQTTEGTLFLVKEQSSVFNYQQIEHGAEIKVPVLVGERILKNSQGKYVPAKHYENFIVTEGD